MSLLLLSLLTILVIVLLMTNFDERRPTKSRQQTMTDAQTDLLENKNEIKNIDKVNKDKNSAIEFTNFSKSDIQSESESKITNKREDHA